jgi:hypothetical protein
LRFGRAHPEQRETTELAMEESCGMPPSAPPLSPSAAAEEVEAAADWLERRARKVRMGFSRTHVSTIPMSVGRPRPSSLFFP